MWLEAFPWHQRFSSQISQFHLFDSLKKDSRDLLIFLWLEAHQGQPMNQQNWTSLVLRCRPQNRNQGWNGIESEQGDAVLAANELLNGQRDQINQLNNTNNLNTQALNQARIAVEAKRQENIMLRTEKQHLELEKQGLQIDKRNIKTENEMLKQSKQSYEEQVIELTKKLELLNIALNQVC